MKTTFSRTFFPAAVILLVALCGIGLTFQFIAKYVMTDRAMEQLTVCAQSVSRLVTAYDAAQNAQRQNFIVNLSLVSQVTETDIVLCDAQGTLVLCSDAPMGCSHQGLQVGKEYLQAVVSAGVVENTGVVRGIFDEARHVVSVPAVDSQGNLIGLVMVSAPIAESLKALNALSRFFLMITLTILVVSIVVMSVVARKHSDPLRQMSRAAVAFGHGDLTARVNVRPDSPVEIRELALAFNNMAVSLQKSEYQRQEFVANVSHELKTPMTTIAGFADGILDGTIPEEKHSYYLQLISAETKRLSRLVRSMLDISRLQAVDGIPEEQLLRFDITECAGQVLLGFEQKITQKELDVQVDMPQLPVYTRAQKDYIVQVIYNLLDNAVKFCPAGGLLGLTVRTGGNKIYLSITNAGDTIPAEELPLVFDRFHKIDKSRMQNRDGWGLGLYIVRTIICAHGEDISVESQAGKTTFTFTLPLIN